MILFGIVLSGSLLQRPGTGLHCDNLLIVQICSEHRAVCGAMVDYARMRRISCMPFVSKAR